MDFKAPGSHSEGSKKPCNKAKLNELYLQVLIVGYYDQ